MSELGMIPNPADEVELVSFLITVQCDGADQGVSCSDYKLCPDCIDPVVCPGITFDSVKVHDCPCQKVN